MKDTTREAQRARFVETVAITGCLIAAGICFALTILFAIVGWWFACVGALVFFAGFGLASLAIGADLEDNR